MHTQSIRFRLSYPSIISLQQSLVPLGMLWIQSMCSYSIATHISRVILGCPQTWWSAQYSMKACLCFNQHVLYKWKSTWNNNGYPIILYHCKYSMREYILILWYVLRNFKLTKTNMLQKSQNSCTIVRFSPYPHKTAENTKQIYMK